MTGYYLCPQLACIPIEVVKDRHAVSQKYRRGSAQCY